MVPTSASKASARNSLAFVLGLTVVCQLVAEGSYHLLTASGLRQRMPSLVAMEIPPALGGLVVPYLVIRLVYGKTLAAFGVHGWKPGRRTGAWLLGASAATLAAWAAIWVALFGMLSLVSRGGAEVPMTCARLAQANPLARLLGSTPAQASSRDYVVHVFLTVGFAEELFGRGLLVNALEPRYGRVWRRGRWPLKKSTVLAALLFAAWHIQYMKGFRTFLVTVATSMTIVVVPSLLLTVVYDKTRSLAATIVLHNVIDGGKLLVWYIVGRLFVG